MIITTTQAYAIYRSMVELNDIGAYSKVTLSKNTGCWIVCFQNENGIHVRNVDEYMVVDSEEYKDQTEFSFVYGVN